MYPAQPNSPYTTILGEISASDTAVVVADASVLPSTLPFLMTLGFDKSASETVLVTAVDENTLTITRGVDGNALLWVAGTKCARIFTAKDLNDVQSNILALKNAVDGKQEQLVSGTNIKTVGGQSLLGDGDISELPGKTESDEGKFLKTSNNTLSWGHALTFKKGEEVFEKRSGWISYGYLAYGNGRLIARYGGKNTKISTDHGLTWTTGGVIGTDNVSNRNIFFMGKYFFAFSNPTNTKTLYRSSDGLTWTACTGIPDNNKDISFCADDGMGNVVFSSGGQYIYYSNDYGETFHVSTGSQYAKNIPIIYDGQKFMAMSLNYIYTSTDHGATWVQNSASCAGTGGAAYGNGVYLCYQWSAPAVSSYYRSVNGTAWTSITIDPEKKIGWLGFLNDKFIIRLSDGSMGFSKDGLAWKFKQNMDISTFTGMAFSGKRYALMDGYLKTCDAASSVWLGSEDVTELLAEAVDQY